MENRRADLFLLTPAILSVRRPKGKQLMHFTIPFSIVRDFRKTIGMAQNN